VVLYRLTEEGLNAKKLPVPVPQRKPSNSDWAARALLHTGEGNECRPPVLF